MNKRYPAKCRNEDYLCCCKIKQIPEMRICDDDYKRMCNRYEETLYKTIKK